MMMLSGRGGKGSYQGDDAAANDEFYSMYNKLRLRDGTHDNPATDCRMLFSENPDLKSGMYWVDPDGGSLLNAIQVYCKKEMRSTCISAKKSTFATKAYVTRGSEKHEFVAKHMGTSQFEYSVESSQLNMLRLRSDSATQTLTYKCRNSVAVEDAAGRKNKSVILYTAGDKEYKATNSRFKYTVLQDDCKYAKSSEAQTVIEINTNIASHLPIVDIAPGDVGSSSKAFGVEIGEVCFS